MFFFSFLENKKGKECCFKATLFIRKKKGFSVSCAFKGKQDTGFFLKKWRCFILMRRTCQTRRWTERRRNQQEAGRSSDGQTGIWGQAGQRRTAHRRIGGVHRRQGSGSQTSRCRFGWHWNVRRRLTRSAATATDARRRRASSTSHAGIRRATAASDAWCVWRTSAAANARNGWATTSPAATWNGRIRSSATSYARNGWTKTSSASRRCSGIRSTSCASYSATAGHPALRYEAQEEVAAGNAPETDQLEDYPAAKAVGELFLGQRWGGSFGFARSAGGTQRQILFETAGQKGQRGRAGKTDEQKVQGTQRFVSPSFLFVVAG